MPAVVTMPRLTDSMEEGRIVAWKVRPGDRVRPGDVLAEIETDKAVMELESFWSGTVAEILAEEGAVVPVGTPIARIAEAGEAASEASDAPPTAETAGPSPPEPARPAAGTPAPAAGAIPLPGAHPVSERAGRSPPPAPAPSPAPMPGGRASPRARRLARERGVDLAALQGTGPEGAVTGEDVLAAAPEEPSPLGATPRPSPARRGGDQPLPPGLDPAEAEVEEISFFQKAAIQRVVASQREVPHFYLTRAVRADRLLERKAAERERSGATLTHLVLRASALALQRFPQANRSYDRGRWIRWKVVNLGLAVQTDAGLAVIVLRGAQGRDLGWIASNTRDLVERARAGKLRPEDRANPTFTVSNLGAFDVDAFAALVNPPSALTLALGSVRPTPVAEDDRIEIARVMQLTLSCDHRVVDGVLAARFAAELARLLEDPREL